MMVLSSNDTPDLSHAVTVMAMVLGVGCTAAPWPDPPPLDPAVFLVEHQTWRAQRQSQLQDSAHSFTHWVGLWPLREGGTPFGTDSALPLVLPPTAGPRLAGLFRREGRRATLELEPSVRITFHDGTLASGVVPLLSDSLRSPTCVRLGSVHLWIHDELGRLFIRMADEAAFPPDSFRMPEQFPPDLEWRVAAKLERFRQPRSQKVLDVTGEVQDWVTPGHLLFRLHGRRFRLPVYREVGDTTTLRLMFRDSTNASETYGAGRYLSVLAPDLTGWTVIDFNRARNPPCAFTASSVCALPPPGNRLAAAVTAGEKRFADPRADVAPGPRY